MKSFLIAIGLVLASTFVGVVQSAELEPYSKEHYRILMKQWSIGTPEVKEQVKEVYWIMQAHDMEIVQLMLPIRLSPSTESFKITMVGTNQAYHYNVTGQPHSPEQLKTFISLTIDDLCGNPFTSFQIMAMEGTITFKYYFDGELVNDFTISKCGPGV